MSDVNCPTCGAGVPMRGDGLPYATCAYCRTLLMRHGLALEAVGTVAELPGDVSPIQIGTRFTVDARELRAVGRVRWGWSGGSWNEWLLLAADGTRHWLGEAMGMYMLTAEYPAARDIPAIRNFAEGNPMAVDATLKAGGQWFHVADIKDAACLGSEGDLPFPTLPGWAITSVDFRNDAGAALSVQRDRDGTSVWLGQWYDLAGLAPQGLRVIEGWAIPDGMA